jgi:methyl-accepting chemotaxis protein
MYEFLSTAITAHARWKDELKNAIDHGQLPDLTAVRADDRCDLGKWIYNEGKNLQNLNEYQNLKLQHAQFHQVAANVVEMIAKGDKKNAKTEIESGAFAAATVKVINAISKLRLKIA